MQAKFTPFTMGFVVAISLALPAHAQDGRNPPGVNPTHYQCYSVEAPASEITLKALRDQFGASEAVKLGRPVMLCAPTQKNNLAPRDRTTHYLCYEEAGAKPADRKVRIINQLTKQTGIALAVQAPRLLCVPSLKRLE